MNTDLTNSSVIGRLLEELSWVGSTIRNYRGGGRGYENVLTAEALQGLDYLPREAFLGAVLQRARGADCSRERLVSEVEAASLSLLPGDFYLKPYESHHATKLSVQPDGLLESPSVFGLIEAKRIKRSSFQPEQLSREFVLALSEAKERAPLLILILGEPPPVLIAKGGRMDLEQAVDAHLEKVLLEAQTVDLPVREARARIADSVCWITWHEVADVVSTAAEDFRTGDTSIDSTIARLAQSVTQAIMWHS